MTRPDLIERARRGDREAFAELAALEIDRLHATATLILRDMHLAQDAVQETLIRCWRQLPNLRDVATFDGWLETGGSCEEIAVQRLVATDRSFVL